MRKITIKLKSLKVSRLNLRESMVELIAVFNDGADKETAKAFYADREIEGQVNELFAEIVKIVSGIHQRFERGMLVKDIVTTVFESKEETRARIVLFLTDVFGKVRTIRSAKMASGYLSMINSIQSMGLKL